MKTYFEIKQGKLASIDAEKASVVVYSVPNDNEKKELFETLGQDWHDLESALDPDEISRVEFYPDDMFIIWKQPETAMAGKDSAFKVSSVGLFLKNNRLTIILREDSPPFVETGYQQIDTLHELVLKFFLQTVRHYFHHLKSIKQLANELQAKLNRSMENRYFLKIFQLSESLIYYRNALEANASVLLKLRANADRIGMRQEDRDTLDDVVIELDQCNKQTEIFSTVLSGLMDARGNIVNNNMNVLLKNLTLINVVFLPLTLIAGIGGMSEFSMMTQRLNWKLSYALLVLSMVVVGLVMWRVLVRHSTHKR